MTTGIVEVKNLTKRTTVAYSADVSLDRTQNIFSIYNIGTNFEKVNNSLQNAFEKSLKTSKPIREHYRTVYEEVATQLGGDTLELYGFTDTFSVHCFYDLIKLLKNQGVCTS